MDIVKKLLLTNRYMTPFIAVALTSVMNEIGKSAYGMLCDFPRPVLPDKKYQE